MKPSELSLYLSKIINQNIKLSVMIWGAPGIGKSSIVTEACQSNGLDIIDLRLSQLAPTDLRGLPVPKDKHSSWLPPEFLPTEGKGILFLDEINMAPPAMQGIAQQLILDRRVGSYILPDGWFVWAAGNRKEHKSAVYDMPSPLANRFIHLNVELSSEDFRQFAYTKNFHENIIAFVAFREDLLHKIMDGESAWPSPRSWEMANILKSSELDIAPAVGTGPASEFYAFLDIIEKTPDLDKVAQGNFSIEFPIEPSLRYATVMGLVGRSKKSETAIKCFNWLVDKAPAEWVQLFATDLFPQLRRLGELEPVHKALMEEPKLKAFLNDFIQLMNGPE
ncbi:AAA family ATPase [Pleionea mediterranea]|uniref:Dynein-related subfamily AAA family protein n=1 Tax=Pleionea mediterranea TaxID=523701 RepID=A0A316F710_9GAMM|nr:MoxR family ATPase [Pleionea mediterranea]PWK42193.1 dynein-related subfamily AAA family protein [Pleionea mediterranea]